LVTNPSGNVFPEELLLDKVSVTEDDYIVIRYSNLVEGDNLIMDENHLDEMRDYLSVIHDEFQILYNADEDDGFAVDIEYKVTSEGQLIIKQARPWASYWSDLGSGTVDPNRNIDVNCFPNPVQDYLNIYCDCNLSSITVLNIHGQQVLENQLKSYSFGSQINLIHLTQGLYLVNGFDVRGNVLFTRKFIKK